MTTIASQAFYGCTSLTKVTIPGSVKNIDPSAFDNTNLQKIIINANRRADFERIKSLLPKQLQDKALHIPAAIPKKTIETLLLIRRQQNPPLFRIPRVVAYQIADNLLDEPCMMSLYALKK